MNDCGIQFLSSLSPKINQNKKNKSKGPTVLSLKKHFRRSLSYDQFDSTIPSKSLSIIEISSSDSGCSKKLKSSSEIFFDELNGETEYTSEANTSLTRILESDNEEIISPSPNKKEMYFECLSTSKKKHSNKIQTRELTKTKLLEIINWVENVDKFNDENQQKEDILTLKSFEEPLLSYDDFENKTEMNKNQIFNSTAMQNAKRIGCTDQASIENFHSEMSYREDPSLEKMGVGCNNSCEDLLDDLYGTSWRIKKFDVLPTSEKTHRFRKVTEAKKSFKSEQKPKIFETNKNLDFNTDISNPKKLLKKLQTKTIKKAIDSPFIDKSNLLCDESDFSKMDRVKSSTRGRLNFDNATIEVESAETNSLKSFNEQTETFEHKDVQNYNDMNNSHLSDKENDFSGKIIPLEYTGRKKSSNELKKNKKHIGEEEVIITKPDLDNKNMNKKRTKKNICSENLEESCNTPSCTKYISYPVKPREDGTDVDKRRITNKKLTKCYKDFSDSSEEKTLAKPTGNTRSFLESLSQNVPDSECNASAKIFRNNYKQQKDNLAKQLFNLYNKKVFDNALPDTTVLEWNSRMSSTAGYCCSKKVTHRTGNVERVTKIVLSSKVLDSADRLRDTLIHEMCHAATWIVNHVSNGHGEYWIAWTKKAKEIFPELPSIKRCHNYQINTKYVYKCIGCSYSIGRHRKSLDIERKRCGYCLGKFEVLINKTNKKGEQKIVPVKAKRKPAGFALFVKENYSDIREPGLNHADIMKLLSEKFNQMKV